VTDDVRREAERLMREAADNYPHLIPVVVLPDAVDVAVKMVEAVKYSPSSDAKAAARFAWSELMKDTRIIMVIEQTKKEAVEAERNKEFARGLSAGMEAERDRNELTVRCFCNGHPATDIGRCAICDAADAIRQPPTEPHPDLMKAALADREQNPQHYYKTEPPRQHLHGGYGHSHECWCMTEPPYTGTTITTKKVPTTETSQEARCPTCGLRDNQVFPYQRPCPDCQKATP